MPREKSPSTPTVRKRAPRKASAASRAAAGVTRFVDPERRAALIAEAAFFRAEKRGFAPGMKSRTGSPRNPKWTRSSCMPRSPARKFRLPA
jgi:hypothetical protein